MTAFLLALLPELIHELKDFMITVIPTSAQGVLYSFLLNALTCSGMTLLCLFPQKGMLGESLVMLLVGGGISL